VSRAEEAEKRLLWLLRNVDVVELEAVVGRPCATLGEAVDAVGAAMAEGRTRSVCMVPPIGFAVRMAAGPFVGIWQQRELAERMCTKQPASHGDVVIAVYDRPTDAIAIARERLEHWRAVCNRDFAANTADAHNMARRAEAAVILERLEGRAPPP
jgi:hypothetical protein